MGGEGGWSAVPGAWPVHLKQHAAGAAGPGWGTPFIAAGTRVTPRAAVQTGAWLHPTSVHPLGQNRDERVVGAVLEQLHHPSVLIQHGHCHMSPTAILPVHHAPHGLCPTPRNQWPRAGPHRCPPSTPCP